MLFMTPNDQCQSTEGNIWNSRLMQQSNIHHHFTDIQHCVWSQSQSVSNSMWLCLSVSHTATPTLHCLASHTVHQPTVSQSVDQQSLTHSLSSWTYMYVWMRASSAVLSAYVGSSTQYTQCIVVIALYIQRYTHVWALQTAYISCRPSVHAVNAMCCAATHAVSHTCTHNTAQCSVHVLHLVLCAWQTVYSR